MKPLAFYLKTLLLAVVVVLAPIKSMLIVTTVLIIVDFFTGILAARAKKQAITSRGFRSTATKGTIYLLGIVLSYLTQKYLLEDSLPITNWVTSFVGLTELTSIFENMNVMGDGKLLKSIVNKLNNVNKE